MKASLISSRFKRVLSLGVAVNTQNIRFKYLLSDNRSAIGFTINKKLGLAVERNQFKRRCRAFFKNITNKPKSRCLSLVVMPNQSIKNIENLEDCFLDLEKEITTQ